MSTVKELEKNKVQVEFEISAEAVKNAKVEAYNKNKGKFSVPGFRKGHAPKGMIEQYYGEGVFFEDAFEIAFPDAYSAALKENNIIAVSRPENVDILSMEPLKVTAEVYTKPEVELGDYKGLTVEVDEVKITDEAVDNAIEEVRGKNASFVNVDREATIGDMVIIDYSGSVDGVKFDGGTAENQQLELGSHTFIPGFEEQVVGMKVDETKDINVTFPEQYHSKDLAGKDAVFTVTVHEVKEKQLPELDDEFAVDVSEFDTFDEYKADVKAKMIAEADERRKNVIENEVIKAAADNATIDIPACMIDQQVDYKMQEMQYSLMYQGIDMPTYLQYIGATEEQLKAELRPAAEETVKSQLVLEAIIKAENIDADKEDIDKEIAKRAENQKKTVEEVSADMTEDMLEYIKDRVRFDKVIELLVSTAKVKKPAKKAAKKKTEAKTEEKPASEQPQE